MTTIYKKDPKDNIRINTHNKTYWIKEFESNGFRFVPEKLDTLLKERNAFLKERVIPTFTTTQGNSIKFKFGKLLYQRGGFIGKQLIFLYRFLHNKFFSNYGILLFVKEAK